MSLGWQPDIPYTNLHSVISMKKFSRQFCILSILMQDIENMLKVKW